MEIPKTEKSFFQRWKNGITSITAYQQARITYWNTYIMIIGIISGIIVTFFFLETIWWLTIILFSALINTVVVQLGNYQKYITLRRLFKDV